MFNHLRPFGDGVECMFGPDPVQQAVLNRIRQVFHASAASWRPSDIYLVMRNNAPIGLDQARVLAHAHLAGMESIAKFSCDRETEHALVMLREQPGGPAVEDVITTRVYDCFTDFLARFQPAHDPMFLLKEPLYSLANDYYLMAYMLWPAINTATGLPDLLDPYFDLWRHGVQLAGDGTVSVAS